MLAICCCLSAASGQWLDKTITLSDSLGSIWPGAVYCVPGSNWVYIANDDDRGVIVVDAATNARVARIDARAVSFFAYDSHDDKVYLSGEDGVTAVNPSTHHVISRIDVGNGPSVLCYNSNVNKLYCRTGSDDDSVTVVDCNTDLATARIWVGSSWYEFQSMSCVSIGNKVYFASFEASAVAVIDGVGDSLLKLLPVGDEPTALACNPISNKLYGSSYGDDEVAVYDAGPDTLLRLIEVGGGPLALCYNPISNKLYCGGGDDPSLDIIDCNSDTVVAEFELAGGDPVFFQFDSVDNRVFCFPDYGQSFAAISGTGDTIVGEVRLNVDAYEPNPAGYDPQQNRLYVRGRSSGDVCVVDAAGLGVVAAILMNAQPYQGCYVEPHDRFYASDDESGLIAVINCSTDSLERWILTPGTELGSPIYSTGSDKLYYSAYTSDSCAILVVDCARDTLVAVLPVHYDQPVAMVYNPATDRVYWTGWSADTTVLVFDCAGDSVVARVQLGGYPTALACNPDSNRMYCTAYLGDSTFICAVDCATESVIGTVFVHTGSSSYDFLCYIPTRGLVVATGPDTSFVVIDGAARQVLQTVPLSARLWESYFDRASNKLYGLTSRSDLAAIDCRDMSLEAELRLASYPSDLAVDTIANRVWATSHDFGCMSLVNGRTNRFLGLLDAGKSPGDITWLPQYRKMYVVDQRGQSVLVFRDTSLAGVYENSASPVVRAMPTIVHNVLFLPKSASPSPSPSSLMDISGRKVLDLKPGSNDVRALSPGVYFVCSPSPSSSPPEGERVGVRRRSATVTKVIIAR